jgi:hypothetical protein
MLASVAGDALRQFADLLDDAGDVLAIAVSVADDFIWTSQISATGSHPDWVSLESMGASLETTVGEWMTIVGTQHSDSKVLVSV